MSRKVVSTLVVNDKTGEVLKSTSIYTNKRTESFIMLRKTDGLEWFIGLKNSEKNLLILMHDWADPKTGRVSLNAWQRAYVTEKLSVNRRNISLILHGLIENNCIVRISQNDFMVNPAHMFKCSASEVEERIYKYKLLKSKL